MKEMKSKNWQCSHCGADVTALVEQALRAYMSRNGRKGGARRTEAQIAHQKEALAAMNASMTPEKIAAAQKKRLVTLRRKRLEQNKGPNAKK